MCKWDGENVQYIVMDGYWVNVIDMHKHNTAYRGYRYLLLVYDGGEDEPRVYADDSIDEGLDTIAFFSDGGSVMFPGGEGDETVD